MGMNSVVRVTVHKTFEVELKDGQKVELEQDEAEAIRDALNAELPKVNGISSINYMKSHVVVTSTPPAMKNAVEVQTISNALNTRRPIPTGYVLMKKEKSHPRNGRRPVTYAYYKDAAENYGFQMEESNYNSFFRLGKVADPQSTIGRFIRKIPTDSYLSKAKIQKNRIFSNTQTMKAMLDILEMERMIERAPIFDGRIQSSYRRLVKLTDDVKAKVGEPEGWNTHGALHAQLAPSGP